MVKLERGVSKDVWRFSVLSTYVFSNAPPTKIIYLKKKVRENVVVKLSKKP